MSIASTGLVPRPHNSVVRETMHQSFFSRRVFGVVLALSAAAAPQAFAGPVLDKIKSSGKIVIAHRESSVPFSYVLPDKKPVGYAVDLCLKLAEAVRKKLDMKTLQTEFLLVTPANRIAVDAVKSASHPHHFMAVTKAGRSAIAATSGNEDCHVILRGGSRPNYDRASVDAAAAELSRAGVAPRIMIDASHANSGKKPENQPLVVADIRNQISHGERRIVGVMIESNLVAGRQDALPGMALTYGQSITDGCIDWNTTVPALKLLADAVTARRRARSGKFREYSA